MTDHLRFPYDKPDHYDDTDSPWNRPIRHGKLKHPILTYVAYILLAGAIGGGIGTVLMALATWAGIVE